MTTTMNTNGRVRKNLADQIDRLDAILDGLAEGLNEAVAGAVKEAVALAVQEAVRGVLAEFLTNPVLLDKLRANLGVPPAAVPVTVVATAPTPRASRVAARILQARAWLGAGWQTARRACAAVVGTAQQTLAAVQGTAQQALAAVQGRWQRLRQFRMRLRTALAVGVVVGVVAYCGGPYVAAVTGWVAGFTTTLAAQAVVLWRRTFAAPEMPTTSAATGW